MDAAFLAALNPTLSFVDAGAPEFSRYGRLVDSSGLAGLVDLADHIAPYGLEANAYVASEPALESHPASAAFGPLFGFVGLQVGWNAGPNSRLNGLEWHGSPEFLVAVTDSALFLGREEDVEWNGSGRPSYRTELLVCLFLPRGAALWIRPGTLHLAPCRVAESGFKSVVVLPRGTNSPLSEQETSRAETMAGRGDARARALFARNKWILAHPERTALTERGAVPGILGENLEVRY